MAARIDEASIAPLRAAFVRAGASDGANPRANGYSRVVSWASWTVMGDHDITAWAE
jgi:hypothetical protein